jgi:hypothetical protein
MKVAEERNSGCLVLDNAFKAEKTTDTLQDAGSLKKLERQLMKFHDNNCEKCRLQSWKFASLGSHFRCTVFSHSCCLQFCVCASSSAKQISICEIVSLASRYCPSFPCVPWEK